MNRLRKWPLSWRLFAVAFVVLVLVCAPIPSYDADGPQVTDVYEFWAHQLGHWINSVWVGVSLLMLAIPALWNKYKKRADSSVWWVPDAILCDVLLVDVFGKDRFTSLGRPMHDSIGAPSIGQGGFPSGHATFAFLVAYLITEKYPKLGPLWFAMATAISWSRIEVHAHYNYQVFAGAIFGAVIGSLVSSRAGGILLPRLFLKWPAKTLLVERGTSAAPIKAMEIETVEVEHRVLV